MLSSYIYSNTRSLRRFCLITQYTVTIDRITARQLDTVISRVIGAVGASVRDIVPVANLVGALLEIISVVRTLVRVVLLERVVFTKLVEDCDPLEVGVELVVPCLDGFRGSFPYVLKMMT